MSIDEIKAAGDGERQAKVTLDEIEPSHLARYFYVCRYLKTGNLVLDLGGGVGYGAYAMALHGAPTQIVTVDWSPAAHKFGKQYYSSPRITWLCGNVLEVELSDEADVVVAFELIEHLDDPSLLLERVRRILRPGGLFFCSTPDQDQIPFDPVRFKYHKRHYTAGEFEALLSKWFTITERRHVNKNCHDLGDGWNVGHYNLAIARPR